MNGFDKDILVNKIEDIFAGVVRDVSLSSEYESDARDTWPKRWEEARRRCLKYLPELKFKDET